MSSDLQASITSNPAPTVAAKDIQSALEYTNLKILRVVKQFNDPKHFKFLDGENNDCDDDVDDSENEDGGELGAVGGTNNAIETIHETRDPAIVAADVAAHLVRF
jgi:hypothetical protein